MTVAAIAYSYWRSIKRRMRTFESVSDNLNGDVMYLAKVDVANGVITKAEFEQYIGVAYTPIQG